MKLRTLLLACLIAIPFAARADDADADKMIADFNALQAPAFDSSRREDKEYVQSYMAERKAFNAKRADFGKDFYAKFPQNPRAMEFMLIRWKVLASDGEADQVITETDKMLADHPDDAHRADILFGNAMGKIMKGKDSPAAMAAIDAFIKAAPKDERGGQLLFQMSMLTEDPATKTQLTKRLADEFGDTEMGMLAKGQMRRTDAIGKPFELSFTDAISGNKISMADLKGKVVVVDFWATWCGPCVGEMPNMKKLYAEYKDKGVEFIGVSLDNPGDGLDKLKDFVKKNEITWPQYYQGKAWNSEFSAGWGVNSIPCVFVIDAKGNLYSTDARGKLEKMLPDLLSKGVAQM